MLGCVLILPLDLYAWLLGLAADGQIPLRKLHSLKVEGPLADGLWGVSHLWFLQYLWLFCMGAALVTWFAERRRKDHLGCAGEESADENQQTGGGRNRTRSSAPGMRTT